MVRRGWQQLNVPTGWVQILRGPRPKAEKWPAASAIVPGPPNSGGGRWRRVPQSGGDPQTAGSRRLNPDEALAAARARVSRLETALEVLGESDSTEVRTLREVLKQARHSAQEQPISAQIKDTEEFIARSTNRLQVLATKRSEEEQLLENATARLARLRELATSGPPPASHTADLDVQVSELKAKLAVVEAERDARAKEADVQKQFGVTTVVDMDMILKDPDPKRPCCREDFVPHCDEEMQEWMEDRQKDLQAALVLDGFQKWPGCHIC